MKYRIIIVSLIVALMTLPATASAWWWKKDRETLVDVAVAANDQLGVFNTLLTLVTADKKVFRRLDGYFNTTVFAPTDQAFADLLDIVSGAPFCYASLDEIPSWYVSDVLNYHLTRGKKESGDVFGASKVRMSFGGYVFPDADTLSLADNATNSVGLPASNIVVIDGVQTFDVLADNGVIHTIDRVLLPYLPPSNCD